MHVGADDGAFSSQWNVIAPQVGDYRCGFHVNNCGVVYSTKIVFAR